MLRFGQMVAEQRKALGYTQETLAEMVGCSQSYVSIVESGKVFPERIEKFCRALNIEIETVVAYGASLADDVERAIVNSRLDLSAQEVVLKVYGYVAERNSVEIATAYRIAMGKEKIDARTDH